MALRAGVLALVVLASPMAGAQECPLPKGANAALGQLAPDVRLGWIRDTLLREASRATWWRWTWASAFAAGATAQFAITPALARPIRDQLYTTGAATALLILPPVVWPLRVTHDASAFDAHAQATPPGDLCRTLQLGEDTLARDALDEMVHAGWAPQLVNVGYDAVIALVVGLVTRQWLPALVSGLGGLILGEAYILTQPAHLVDAWRTYQSGQLPGPPGPALSLAMGGLGISGTF